MPKSKEKKQKYYAVKQGHVPGIYYNWNDTQAQVKGFKKAKFKSFTQLLEAEQWLGEREGLLGEEDAIVSSLGPSAGPFERDVQGLIPNSRNKEIQPSTGVNSPQASVNSLEFPFPVEGISRQPKEIQNVQAWNVYVGCALDPAALSAWVSLRWELEELCISLPYSAAPPLTAERALLFALQNIARQALRNPNLSSNGFCVHLGTNAYTVYMIATRWMWTWADKQWEIKFPHLDLVIPLHRLMSQFDDSTRISFKHHTTEPIPTAFISAQQSAASALRGQRWANAEYIS